MYFAVDLLTTWVITMKVFLTLLLFLCIGFTSNAQSLKIGIGGGPAFISSSGIPSGEDIDNNIDFKNGYQIGGKIKVGFLIPFNLVGQINYYKLKGDGTIIYHPAYSSFAGPEDVDLNTTLLSVVIGGQYELIPGPLAPHLDFDLMFTSFGETSIKYLVSSAQEMKVDGQSRLGLAIGAGVDLKLLPAFDLELGIKYNMHNLFGKEDGEEGLNTVTLTGSILFDVL